MMKKKIAIVVSSPMMVNFFLISQLNYLTHKFDVTLITGPEAQNISLEESLSKKVKVIQIHMKRKIAFFSDIRAFFQLAIIFLKFKFNIVHSVSPKSGFLCQSAAFICGVNIRIHTFTGQVWVNKRGLLYWLLKSIDMLIVKMSTNILVDSYSQRAYLMSENILDHENSSVLLNGSISGVDGSRFNQSLDNYYTFRNNNNIGKNSKIILFIGRLAKDKGIVDLIEAFNSYCGDINDSHLLLVGPDEENILENFIDIKENPRIHYFNYTKKPEFFMKVSDILCLPSLREGFGNVVLEAALCGIPSIVTDIYGLKDVVEKNHTALVFKVSNVDDLGKSLANLINNDEKRILMGSNAMKRADYLFSKQSINEAIVKFYVNLLKHNLDV